MVYFSVIHDYDDAHVPEEPDEYDDVHIPKFWMMACYLH